MNFQTRSFGVNLIVSKRFKINARDRPVPVLHSEYILCKKVFEILREFFLVKKRYFINFTSPSRYLTRKEFDSIGLLGA